MVVKSKKKRFKMMCYSKTRTVFGISISKLVRNKYSFSKYNAGQCNLLLFASYTICIFIYDNLSTRHSPSNSDHSESAVFKQPPPIEPTRSSPPPTHRDPPWPHGGPSPNRPSSTERPQSLRGEAASAPVTSGHLRGPRTYKIVSSKSLVRPFVW